MSLRKRPLPIDRVTSLRGLARALVRKFGRRRALHLVSELRK